MAAGREIFAFWFSRVQENTFPDAFFKICYGVPGTNYLWNKRCNGLSCNSLSKAEKPFCQRIFFV